MNRFCYCSRVLPGKEDLLRKYWSRKEDDEHFWDALQMTGFAAWLQGDRLIHCLEGASLEGIFSGLREQIPKKDPVALRFHAFYLEVLGKDYSDPSAQPQIECLMDVERPGGEVVEKRGRCFPLRPEKEQAVREFKRTDWLHLFSITRYTKWLQQTPEGPILITYTEHDGPRPKAPESPLWKEVAEAFSDATGLSAKELVPQVERLT